MTAPSSPAEPAKGTAPVQCPKCGSTQFFGRRKITALGWLLFWSGLAVLLVSIPLMFVMVGWCTIFLAPPLSIIGVYVCRRPVNVCARCRTEF